MRRGHSGTCRGEDGVEPTRIFLFCCVEMQLTLEPYPTTAFESRFCSCEVPRMYLSFLIFLHSSPLQGGQSFPPLRWQVWC